MEHINYYANKREWHGLFNEFVAGLSLGQRTPFFWHLIDNKVFDINRPVLRQELDRFFEAQKEH